MSNNRVFLALLLAIFVVSTYSATTFSNVFDNNRKYNATYQLGYLLNGTSIMINVTSPSTPVLITGLFILSKDQIGAAPLTASVTGTTCTDSGQLSCVVVFDIVESYNYKLTVLKANTPITTSWGIPSVTGTVATNMTATSPTQVQLFYMTVTSYVTIYGGPSNSSAVITTNLKATETLRDMKVKLIYVDSSQDYTFSLYPVFPDLKSVADNAGNSALPIVPDLAYSGLFLYSVASISNATLYTLGATQLLASNSVGKYNKDTLTLTYTADKNTSRFLTPGYYVLAAVYINITSTNYIRLTYTSNTYTCPYSSSFPDYHGNFEPCASSSSQANQPGYPCVSFNDALKQCTQCVEGYILQNGTCYVNTTCPNRTYFHFGNCLDVDSKCNTYESFTGACLTCKDSTHIVVNGSCILPEVNCTSRQYKVNNVCYNASDLCKTFNTSTGACLSCYDNYELKSGTCSLIVPVCTAAQYLKNNVCVKIPDHCTAFDATSESCSNCERGYYASNKVCLKIECPSGQVPSEYGIFCVNVSPLCATYDELTGDCLSCKNKAETIVKGQCLQLTSGLAGCKAREELGYGQCVDADVNCQSYNLQNGECELCVNGWFKSYTGKCDLKNAVCQSDEVSIKGYCQQVPKHCLRVDSSGLCAVCESSSYKIVSGQCVYQHTCENGQYKNEYNQCVNLPAGCSSANPSTGACLICSNGQPANVGLCCQAGETVLNGQCISPQTFRAAVNSAQGSDVPVCIAYHPSTQQCLGCNGNFQVDYSAGGTTCY